MKQIEIDAELYRHIASHTQFIGESASDILRRLLGLPPLTGDEKNEAVAMATEPLAQPEKNTSHTSEPIHGQHALESVVMEELDAQKGKVGRFLYLLSVLYRCHTSDFNKVLSIKGRHRLYFATSETELKASGNSTNPKEVPHSGYWVVTNSNTSKKKDIVERAALLLGYAPADAEQLRDLL